MQGTSNSNPPESFVHITKIKFRENYILHPILLIFAYLINILLIHHATYLNQSYNDQFEENYPLSYIFLNLIRIIFCRQCLQSVSL